MPYLTSHKPNHTELERHDNNPWRRLNDAHNSPYSKPGPRVQVVNDQMCGIRPQVPFLWCIEVTSSKMLAYLGH